MTNEVVLEQNYKYKMMYSPDYRDQDPEQVGCLSNEQGGTPQPTA